MIDSCPRCGYSILPGDFYCGRCGFNIFEKESKISLTKAELKLDDIRLRLGIVYLKKGEFSKAIETFEKVLAEHPSNLQAQELLIEAKEALENITLDE